MFTKIDAKNDDGISDSNDDDNKYVVCCAYTIVLIMANESYKGKHW